MVFLHGEKENFEKYSLILEFAELSFPSLNNYSAEMRRPYPRATIYASFIINAHLQFLHHWRLQYCIQSFEIFSFL
jgi:hypothetical protein